MTLVRENLESADEHARKILEAHAEAVGDGYKPRVAWLAPIVNLARCYKELRGMLSNKGDAK